ncbi:hypothetical protein BGZ61DRAFT_583252 [Ilyonectria robusta]|uniref:uncharacterized protein n=1 Tax=Ilyonectria robusta TaxID=1079257 RepID=UPI001E8D2CA8|nr:uncharacterized protein BGZ61DRAFT_583252 [Ilyonectria robusta]KAH8738309.1 hypothetical protein BGZ61DRAFT_583252 [Ilyonectria robusta]
MALSPLKYPFLLTFVVVSVSLVFIPWDASIHSLTTSLERKLPWLWSDVSVRDDDDGDGGAGVSDPGDSPIAQGGSYSCSKDSPCYNGACCGKDGWCGYGPTYCGTGCQSQCDAHAECGQYSKKPGQTCPLNVCCSEFGFCGTTADFCNDKCQSNCGSPNRPRGSGGDVRDHIIGYYESWKSSGDGCGHMTPSQIPVQVLDAVNLAFGYITPDDYDIVPMEHQTESIFQQVADVKKRSRSTEVWLSLGGWTFNDNDTVTQPIFGELAADSTKAKEFAGKLVEMMDHYGFDGVDIDWEYPGATDRGGKKQTDVDNFPTLLKNIRQVFSSHLKPLKLSITLPTSYWYLRWFDLPELAKHVDFFNIMSYDLHGTWDSSNPIGPYVYAHTNLTEIKLALDLFWREDIGPDMINLGLAFYGRSFKLRDPSCSDPGCRFGGPGEKGRCTDTAGILSYREINEHRAMSELNKGAYTIHDKEAAINYMVYGDKNEDWISYDSKETFEQKIDFANELGLRGLLIWAIDQDDDRYTALKAVTGKDISPRIEESDTFEHWDVSKCFVSGCKEDCGDGFTKMTNLNDDAKTQRGCGGNHKQRSLCCPSWGAPDPKTCSWQGSAPWCYETCKDGDILFATDHYGNGGSNCHTGTKKYCCPANNGNRAVASCGWVSKDTCPNERPQKLYSHTDSEQLDGETVFGTRTLCCPDEPTFEHCTWHGDVGACTNNFCPKSKIQVARSNSRPGGRCNFGRKAVLCCDPPTGDDAILPVALEDLFPYDIPATDKPVYHEAIDNYSDAFPKNWDGEDDPNEQPFAWIVMVGSEKDVQSLRKRDGSHLELFDCPDPAKDDFTIQKLKAVCMVEGQDGNCEDLMLGSVKGTIARLPEDCGKDEWVRVVSFEAIEDHPVPSHLEKRAPENAKVYRLEYDYKFHELRADGGEVFVRADASTHPGYWDEIVASKTGKGISRRDPKNWREDEMSWFRERGFVGDAVQERGESSSLNWWLEKFKALLKAHDNYGVHKLFDYKQVLYSATKSCPGLGDASLEARLEGRVETTFDYGISVIGTLKNFNFDQSYAYFHVHDFNMSTMSVVDAYAKIQMQTQKLPILGWLDLFGGNFNVKGLLEVGPFFDIQAQLRAALTLSGQARAGLTFRSRGLSWMYPQGMNEWPTKDLLTTYEPEILLSPKTEVSVKAKGDLTVAINPALGFELKVTWNDNNLVNNDVRLNFETNYTFTVTAETGNAATCDGLLMGVDLGYGLAIDMSKPIPGWKQTDTHHTIISPRSVQLAETQCKKWSEGGAGPTIGSSRREVGAPTSNAPSVKRVFSRSDVGDDALFPDTPGSSLRCINDFKTPTGDCRDHTAEDDYATDPSLFDKRATSAGTGKKPWSLCDNSKKIYVKGINFPTSGQMIKKEGKYKDLGKFSSWGPSDPDECDDYDFRLLDETPSADRSGEYDSEHVLEWQTLKQFMINVGFIKDKKVSNKPSIAATSPYKDWTTDNPIVAELRTKKKYPQKDEVDFCDYFWFWWSQKVFEYKGVNHNALDHLRLAIPNDDFYRDELQLLWSGANTVKQAMWQMGTYTIRSKSKMESYLKGTTERGKKRDVNDAINVLKDTMFAVRYMAEPDVKRVMFSQADRIYKRMNEFEDMFVAEGKIKGFNDLVYVKLELGEEWKKWCEASYTNANIRHKDFLETWVPRLKRDYLPDEDDESGGDESDGGTEINEDIKKRVEELVKAYDEFKQSPWVSPFQWD